MSTRDDSDKATGLIVNHWPSLPSITLNLAKKSSQVYLAQRGHDLSYRLVGDRPTRSSSSPGASAEQPILASPARRSPGRIPPHQGFRGGHDGTRTRDLYRVMVAL